LPAEAANRLGATALDGTVVHHIVVPLHLAAGENGLAIPTVGTLMPDTDDLAHLGFNNSDSCNTLPVGNLVKVQPFNIKFHNA